MKKKVFTLLLSIFFVFNISSRAFATKELDQNRSDFNEISSSLKDIDNEISKLNDEIYSIEKDIKNNELEIQKTKKEIQTIEDKIESLKIEISENEEILSHRIREMYKNGSTANITVLLSLLESNSFSEMSDRLYAYQSIIKMDKKLIEDNKTKMSELEKSSESIKHKQENLQAINEDINKKLSLTNEKKSEVDKKRADLLNEKEKIANKIKENEEKLISHQLSVVYSDNPTYSQLNDAIVNLKGLLPQISTVSVKSKINSAISEAQYKLSLMNNNSNSSNDDNNTSYKATYEMEATAYYGHGITAMGTKPVRDPNGLSTVAVDKTVIPLGSKLYIPGYGYAIAADTGGAIKQMKIDLFMNTREECYAFGRRKVTVHVIAYPGEW